MRQSYVESEYAEMWIENGIVFQVYKKDLIIDITIARKLFQDRLLLSDSITRPVFVDITNLISIDRSSMKYYKKPEVVQCISATAIYIDNYITRLIGNIFLNISKPLIPTKMFTNKEEALKWLDVYKFLN